MQVLSLLRQKLSNKEIALALNIAEATVKNHVHHLLDKLQVRRREQAAAWLPARRTPLRSRALAEPVSAGPSVRS
jgi:DNA-binding NarL/FixJ family response regulator